MSTAIQTARTFLFVPATRPERFAKALASGADAVVIDLEDAVAASDKPQARDALAQWLASVPTADRARIVVRINDAGTSWYADDVSAMAQAGAGAVLLPKAESAAQVASLRQALPAALVLALVESARGVAAVNDIASAGVARIVFGTLDLAFDLDIDITADASGLDYAGSRIVIASRVAGLPSPVAGITPQIDDAARLLQDLQAARRLGFGAKLCIHPGQVAPLHRALCPDSKAIEWAHRVLAADAAQPGAARLDGRMIDRPVVLQAQRTLSLARE